MRRVLYDIALPTFQRYADAWGYEVETHDIPADGGRSDPGAQAAKWAKVPLIRSALERAAFVIWLDADVLVARVDDDITTRLHPDHFQGLVAEQVPDEHRLNPNTGVWVLRAGAAATAFLDAVEAAGPQPGPWADQGAVLAALGWDPGEHYRWARPGRGTDFLTCTSWLPPGWNQPFTDRTDDESYNSLASGYADRPVVAAPYAVHFMGMTVEGRERRMAEYVREHGSG